MEKIEETITECLIVYCRSCEAYPDADDLFDFKTFRKAMDHILDEG
jgi:hypothetical protein